MQPGFESRQQHDRQPLADEHHTRGDTMKFKPFALATALATVGAASLSMPAAA